MSVFPPPSLAPEDRINTGATVEPQTSGQHQQDRKYETDSQPPIPATPPQISPRLFGSPEYSPRTGEGPIHLAPDVDEERGQAGAHSRFRFWPTTGRFALPDALRTEPEDRGALDNMRRGAVTIIITPIAFIGIALYSCGVIIEGVALLLKGFGALGGRMLARRRQRSQAGEPLWV
ncbi:hypothetical protein JR316_0012610 [Psilocybe cubensis]|uniref:Uncharacterized protein n=2 Tax=Psilocybe cubensis TaxID=181762 RepID=A0A8H7XQJ5_PSICU|nr:hypothetical protein JR316_0012610 [Psilocybe cubensis]KAH9475497.1 hypothetical protein JR316_0012610 [Psilocybe cubensis]